MNRQEHKDVPLEAIRGYAAMCVVAGHCLDGFFPAKTGLFVDKWPIERSLTGSVLEVFFNGGAAVALFFVLSGYVLTRRYMLTGDHNIITRGVAKRWPRLAGPAFLAVMLSYILLATGAYHFQKAGDLVGSPWLSKFAYGGLFPPNLSEAIYQGAFGTFFVGQASYDSSLWTMRYEMIGSLVVFGAAMIVRPIFLTNQWVALFVFVLMAALCHFISPWYVAFPAGVALATFLPERPQGFGYIAYAAAIVLSMYLFGYRNFDQGAFSIFAAIGSPPSTYVHIVASLILITTIEAAPAGMRQVMSGPFSRFIGQLSFPLYLVHIPVLCSLGAGAYLWANRGAAGVGASLFAAAVTVAAAVAAALALLVFNNWWIRIVDRTARAALGQPSSRAAIARSGDPTDAPDALSVGIQP